MNNTSSTKYQLILNLNISNYIYTLCICKCKCICTCISMYIYDIYVYVYMYICIYVYTLSHVIYHSEITMPSKLEAKRCHWRSQSLDEITMRRTCWIVIGSDDGAVVWLYYMKSLVIDEKTIFFFWSDWCNMIDWYVIWWLMIRLVKHDLTNLQEVSCSRIESCSLLHQ